MLLLLFPQLSELVRFESFASVRNIKKKMLIKNYLSGMKKVFLNQNKKLFRMFIELQQLQQHFNYVI